MIRKVRWSRDALDDLKSVLSYIDHENPVAARRVAATLEETANALGRHLTGRPGRHPGMYEKSVAKLPYIIAYEIWTQGKGETVMIVRIIHSARNWPVDAWPES